MTVLELAKQISIYCRMPKCQWSGHSNDLQQHFEVYHPCNVREMQVDSYFQLSFEDLQKQEPFLLSANKGLYWFHQNENKQQQQQSFSRGIFAVGSSAPVEYHIKLGTFSTKLVDILGPFESQEENSDCYDFQMKFDYMAYLISTMTPKVIIYFGEFEDDADEYGTIGMGQWPSEDIPKNYGHADEFTCSLCEKVITLTPLFCDNHHFLCEKCYAIVIRSACPKCDESIYWDTRSEDLIFTVLYSQYEYIVERDEFV